LGSEGMSLSLDSLKSMGAFTGAPVEKEIEWEAGGKKFKATVFVRPFSYATAAADLLAAQTNRDILASRIASSIVDKDGKPIMTVAHITGEADPELGPLDGALSMALLNAIAEVNGLGKTTPSPTRTRSGTSLSSTASGAKPSRKQKPA
jgi:hypothetical protein